MAKHTQKRPTGKARLAEYRPGLDRLLFVLALAGILVTVHLVIQQGRGFDRGCLGFSSPEAAAATFDCNAVVQSDAGKLFGISNAFWGLFYYIVVAALGAGVAFATGAYLQRLKQVRAALIVFGFLYSLYLVSYQVFSIGEFCALCLASAAVAALLFVVQVIEFVQPSRRIAMSSRKVVREAPLFGALAVILIVLVGADVIYFKSLEAAQAPVQAPANIAASGSSAGTPAECYYAQDKAPITDYAELVSFSDPMKGSASAPVTVIEIFEPNCGHCKMLHPTMQQAAQKFGDQAKFYFKPVIFWPERSLMQVHALYAAAQEGKFFEMMDRQFALQNPQTGLSLDQLQRIADEIGMDSDTMVERMQSGAYNFQANRDNMMLRQKHGINSVPAVTINGRFVASNSRTVACIGQLIEEAAQQQ